MKKSFRLSDSVPDSRRDVDDELAFHLDMRAREFMEQGMSEDEARRRAAESFGDLAGIRGRLRQQRSERNLDAARREWWLGFRGDLLYALRSLRSNRAFAIAAIATMALGIGANSAIFSIVNSVLLRPLPYPQPDRLVMLWGKYPNYGRTGLSLPDFNDWRAQATRGFASVAAMHGTTFSYTDGPEPVQLRASRVTANFFTTLGVAPMLGRGFRPDEELGGDDLVVVVSHDFWQRQLGGRPDVVGRSIQLSGQPYTVIGVAPPGFRAGSAVDLWAPAQTDTPNANRRSEYLTAFGRLKPNITLEQADAEIAAIAQRLSEQYPATNLTFRSEVVSMHDEVVGSVRPALLVFSGAVGLVLLIACANVANLLLARAAVREREMAVRSALGASRGRLVRQLLTESTVVSLLGGTLGLVLAMWAVSSLRASGTNLLPRLAEVRIDLPVIVFSVGLAVLTGLAFGLAPALRVSAGRLHDAIKEGARGAAGGVARYRNALVLAEVAVAVILLVGAGLLIRSFGKLAAVDAGFDPRNVLTYRVVLPASRYAEAANIPAVFDQVIERTRQIPGVRGVAASNTLPMLGAGYVTFAIEGHPFPQGDANSAPIDVQPLIVSPDFLRVMGMRLVRGRFIEARDVDGAGDVAVVNTEIVRKYFPAGRDPIGMRVTFGNPTSPDAAWATIVGVVDVVAQEGMTAKPYSQIYLPLAQAARRAVFVSIKTDRDPLAVVPAAREALRGVDPLLPLSDIASMEDRIASDIAPTRMSVIVLTLFAALALTLAAIGIYGVLAYAVAQRTREIGIRMALGASAASVQSLVVRQGMRPALLGLAAGLLGAWFLTELMEKLLFGVAPKDPATFGAVALFLGAVALGASWLPARRATRVAPTEALRYD